MPRSIGPRSEPEGRATEEPFPGRRDRLTLLVRRPGPAAPHPRPARGDGRAPLPEEDTMTKLDQVEPAARSTTRRTFLGSVTTAAMAAGAAGLSPLAASASDQDAAGTADAAPGGARANRAFQVRIDAARFQRLQALPVHRDNGDEDRFARRIGSYSKGLPHNSLGEVDRTAYDSLLTAVRSARSGDFERIIMGGTARLTNPQGGLAFALEGADAAALTIRPAPAFSSAEEA